MATRLIAALRGRWRGSLRAKLVALALLPLLLAVAAMIGILLRWGSVYFDRLLLTKVRSDLAVAHGYFDQVREGIGHRIEAFAASERLARRLRERPPAAALAELLEDTRRRLGVDFLILLDAEGRVRAASNGPPPGALPGPARVIERAFAGQAGVEVSVVGAGELAAIDPALAAKASTPLLTTRHAAPTVLTEETRGMLILGAAPAAGGHVLVGGTLLNQNLDFVDRLNEIVYPEGALPLGSLGTATLFLDDVRIATNVRLFSAERAIGTRASAEVRRAVLEQGQPWLDRAFVVNDWYVSAYEPIADSRGQRLGMLYVGFLDAPFQRARQGALALVAGLFVLVAAGAAVVSLRLARHLSQPVEHMHAAMSEIEAGRVEARVGAVAGEDELAALAAHFDRLLDRLAAQTEALQRWGAELDGKVAERTSELAAANERLRSAQQRLVMSEKLAAIGQLAAGVAHEINNPVAVIQGNLDVLREMLGPAAAPVATELRLIQEQVFRIRQIVAKLLQFARPAEFAGFTEAVALDQVVQDSLVLVAHQVRQGRVEVVREARATQPVTANRNELQQVLINLLVNAMQAMPAGGTLRLTTGERVIDGVAGGFVAVADSGPGIAAEQRARLFEPFVTSKAGEGTGLGLWVSLGLVQRYGGRIEVDSPPAGGTVFTVWLPRAAAG